MALGGCQILQPSMPAQDAVEFVKCAIMQHVALDKNPKLAGALNTIHLAVNENDNLHTDIDEMARTIRDLREQLAAKRQAVFA
jgi:hypothetical protein